MYAKFTHMSENTISLHICTT